MAPVVLGDGAASIEWTGEGGFTFHTASAEVQKEPVIVKIISFKGRPNMRDNIFLVACLDILKQKD